MGENNESLLKKMEKSELMRKRIEGLKNNKLKNVNKDTSTKVITHTEADVNWATVVNKVTTQNLVKGGITLGSVGVGTFVGAGIATGLGFALLGPGGAAVGYKLGNLVGFGTGVIAGHKYGKYVSDKITENNYEHQLVEKGKTDFTIETQSNTETTKEN